MNKQIVQLLPEIKFIEDNDIRQKTQLVWEDAITQGIWKISDLNEIPFTLLIPECPVNIIQHTRSVTNTAIASARILHDNYNTYYKIDFDQLISGSILHDVGKLLEIERNNDHFQKSLTGKLLRHPISGAGLAMKHNLPEKIVHIIAVHAKEGDGAYRCPEAVIVHHADFMNFESLKLQ